MLIIDDASPDDRAEVARKIAAPTRGSRCSSTRRTRATSPRTTRACWSGPTATTASCMSADDRLMPGALRRARAARRASRRRRSSTAGRCGSAGRAAAPTPRTRAAVVGVAGQWWLERRFRQGENCITSPEVVVRTACRSGSGGYDPQLPHAGDIEMWMRLAAHGDVGFIRGVDQAFYRVHGHNMSDRLRRPRRPAPEAVRLRIGLVPVRAGLSDPRTVSDRVHREFEPGCALVRRARSRPPPGRHDAGRRTHRLRVRLLAGRSNAAGVPNAPTASACRSACRGRRQPLLVTPLARVEAAAGCSASRGSTEVSSGDPARVRVREVSGDRSRVPVQGEVVGCVVHVWPGRPPQGAVSDVVREVDVMVTEWSLWAGSAGCRLLPGDRSSAGRGHGRSWPWLERTSGLRSGASALRRRWYVVAGAAIVGLSLGLFYSTLVPVQLSSKALVLLSGAGSGGNQLRPRDPHAGADRPQHARARRGGQSVTPHLTASQVDKKITVEAVTPQLIKIEAFSPRARDSEALAGGRGRLRVDPRGERPQRDRRDRARLARAAGRTRPGNQAAAGTDHRDGSAAGASSRGSPGPGCGMPSSRLS